MNLLLWAELVALLCCIINVKKLQSPFLKWFLPLLALTNVVEWGSYSHFFTIVLQDGKHSASIAYNIFNPIEFCFYTYFYVQLLADRTLRNRIRLLFFLLVGFIIMNICFIQGIMRYFDSYSYIAGCALMVYYAILYFRQILHNPEPTSIFRSAFFWINSGVLIFYSGEFILFSFFEYFHHAHKGFEAFFPVFDFFSNFLNILLYTCLSVAFFCKPIPHNTLSLGQP